MEAAANDAKPSYLGLLNAIALAETNAGGLLEAWAEATPDKELEAVLRLVAARETSHGQLFERRMCELGYGLRQKEDPKLARRLAKLADPKVGDLEKIGDERVEEDPFGEICAQVDAGVFDPMTANLLVWYIAEERDTAALLRAEHARVRARAARGQARPKSNGHAAEGPSADALAIMACMSEGFARLEKSFEKLAKAVK